MIQRLYTISKQLIPGIRAGLLVTLLCLALAAGQIVPAEATSDKNADEYRLKAAFLVHFARFIDWPASHTEDHPGQVIFVIVGEDPFGESIRELHGKTIGGKEIVVRHVQLADELMPCDVVFIPATQKDFITGVLDSLNSAPVVTVSEVDGFMDMGGIINFVTGEKRILRFEINAGQAQQNGLRLSSRLLRLSVRTRG